MRVRKRNRLNSSATEMKNQKKAHLKVNFCKVQLSKVKSSKKKMNQIAPSLFTSVARKWRMIGKMSKRRKKTNVGARI
jgi:hypothetical protein